MKLEEQIPSFCKEASRNYSNVLFLANIFTRNAQAKSVYDLSQYSGIFKASQKRRHVVKK